MKKCQLCGEKLKLTQTICTNCNHNCKDKIITAKQCKYCKSKIRSDATVCPVCKRGLTFGTNTSVLIILFIIIAFFIWGIFSNNAPNFIKEVVCGLGIRDDFPYCYEIKID